MKEEEEEEKGEEQLHRSPFFRRLSPFTDNVPVQSVYPRE